MNNSIKDILNRNFLVIINICVIVVLGILFWFVISNHQNYNKTVQDINELRQGIDSVSLHYAIKMKEYEQETYVLDSIIRLSNKDYEEQIENYWDSVNNNTTDSAFNSELSDFLEDMAGRR